jgi:hypothetical protein
LLSAEQIVPIGKSGNSALDKMTHIVAETSLPNQDIHPLKKEEIGGQGTTNICRSMICSTQITYPGILKEELSPNRTRHRELDKLCFEQIFYERRQ